MSLNVVQFAKFVVKNSIVRLTITLITSSVMKLVRIFILNATNGPVVLVYITAQSVFYYWPTN